MPLTDTTIKNAKPKDKPFKLTDEKGLFLLINPNGSKYFRLKYRYDGKEKVLALGVYPDTSLKMAREQRDKARELLANGIDPSETKKAAKTAKSNTFESVVRDWLASTAHTVRDITHQKKVRHFERHVFPAIGGYGDHRHKSPCHIQLNQALD